MAYRNQFDTRGASAMGYSAEQRFSNLATSRGWSVQKATKKQDRQDKIDVILTGKNGETYSVDVKSRKKINSADKSVDDDIVWFEIVAVGHEYPGWLYGKANLIAFEKHWGFLIVEREKAARYVDIVVDKNAIVNTPEEAYRKIYHRKMFRGLLTWLFSSEVEKFAWDRWLDETHG